jgi:hypothetical protein
VSVDKRPAAIVINVEDTEIHSIVGIGICRLKASLKDIKVSVRASPNGWSLL